MDQLSALALVLSLEFGKHLCSKLADSSAEPSDFCCICRGTPQVCRDGKRLIAAHLPRPPGYLGCVCVPQGTSDQGKEGTFA